MIYVLALEKALIHPLMRHNSRGPSLLAGGGPHKKSDFQKFLNIGKEGIVVSCGFWVTQGDIKSLTLFISAIQV